MLFFLLSLFCSFSLFLGDAQYRLKYFLREPLNPTVTPQYIYIFMSETNGHISFMLFNELKRFLDEIKTNNFTVSNSEIITLFFTVRKKAIS